jgi:hypothetical protein
VETIEKAEDYEMTLKRIEKLRKELILDGAEAVELAGLLASAEGWEDSRKASPLARAKPSDVA